MTGGYTLTASDSSLAVTTPVQFMQAVTPAPTTVAAPHHAASYFSGQTIMLSTTFKSSVPASDSFTGMASIFDQNSDVLGTAAPGCQRFGRFSLTGVDPGTYRCTIDYPGNTDHGAVTSAEFSPVINP